MKIFVINCGSSSIKYQLITMPEATLVCSGLVERIGTDECVLIHKVYGSNDSIVLKKQTGNVDHGGALAAVVEVMMDKDSNVISSTEEINTIGHRVLHGGRVFAETILIDEAVKAQIKKLFPLGPLHLPANLTGIEVAEALFPTAKQVAVFDTAFHQTMPPVAYRYAVGNNYYENNGVRVYGFHGTSHKYVSAKAAAYLGNPNAKIITIHLGNGCSMAAINAGKCMDTSMGLGPLSGLIMGTRCGDIDPSVIFHIIERTGVSLTELQNVLNKKSGMLGLCGLSDMRDIKAALRNGDEAAVLAYSMYAYRIKKYIGSYIAVLNGLDAIVFTGGIGENDGAIRALSLRDMEFFSITYNECNARHSSEGITEYQDAGAKIKVLVVPTNEELQIAKECYELSKA